MSASMARATASSSSAASCSNRPLVYASPAALRRKVPANQHPQLVSRRVCCQAGRYSVRPPSAEEQGNVGIVIVDHGSRKKTSNEMLVEFGKLYQEVTGSRVVEVAHMEIAEPTIEQAIGKCASQGVDTVVVAPYFLSRGRHIQEDIPALIKEAQVKYPNIKCLMAEPIGVDPLMAQLISNRVQAALHDVPVQSQVAANSN